MLAAKRTSFGGAVARAPRLGVSHSTTAYHSTKFFEEPRNERDFEQLFIVAKEGVLKDAREEVYEKARCVNRFVIAALLTSDMFVSMLKRELRKIGDGISIEDAEIASLLRGDVLCSDLFNCEEAKAASFIVARHFKSAMRKSRKDKINHDVATNCESKSVDGVSLISQSDATISNGAPLAE